MKLTKSQLKRIIKEELESVLSEEEVSLEDELFGPEAMIEIPTAQLNEDLGVLTIPLGVVLAIGATAGLFAAPRILKGFLTARSRIFQKDLEAKAQMEYRLVAEILSSDVVLKMKIEKYLEVLDVVENNKGKRSPELALIRKQKTPLSKEITADIQDKMREYGETIDSPYVKAIFQRRITRGYWRSDIRQKLIKDIADELSKTEESPALTLDLNAALRAVKAGEAGSERENKVSMARRASAAQRSKQL
jgi:hypothetical protein